MGWDWYPHRPPAHMYSASFLAVYPLTENRSHLLSKQALGNDDGASSRLLYNVLMLNACRRTQTSIALMV